MVSRFSHVAFAELNPAQIREEEVLLKGPELQGSSWPNQDSSGWLRQYILEMKTHPGLPPKAAVMLASPIN